MHTIISYHLQAGVSLRENHTLTAINLFAGKDLPDSFVYSYFTFFPAISIISAISFPKMKVQLQTAHLEASLQKYLSSEVAEDVRTEIQKAFQGQDVYSNSDQEKLFKVISENCEIISSFWYVGISLTLIPFLKVLVLWNSGELRF